MVQTLLRQLNADRAITRFVSVARGIASNLTTQFAIVNIASAVLAWSVTTCRSRSIPGHHLIIAHEVTHTGSDRAQLANIASRAKDVLGVDKLEAVADQGYYSGDEILS
jgi:hypothetical protein